MIAVSTETNRIDVIQNSQVRCPKKFQPKLTFIDQSMAYCMSHTISFKKDAAAKSALEASQQSVTESLREGTAAAVSQFKAVTSAAAEEAQAKRDQFIRMLGRDLVDGFKPRMCIAPKIHPDYTIEYTPDPIRMNELSDEGQRCSS